MYFDLQKPGMLKRISALILDIILIMVLATGFATAVSAIINYDECNAELDAMFEKYQREYGISFNMTTEEYDALDPETVEHYESVARIMEDDEELARTYSLVINMTLVILSVGILLALTVSDIVVPLLFGNGQTVGKRIFGIGLMQTDHTKLRTFALFVRTLLGKYAVETMIPVLTCVMIYFGFIGIGGTIAMIILLIVQLVSLTVSQTDAAIHDHMASTVVVDLKSQKIFRDAKEMEEYKQKLERMDEKRAL